MKKANFKVISVARVTCQALVLLFLVTACDDEQARNTEAIQPIATK